MSGRRYLTLTSLLLVLAYAAAPEIALAQQSGSESSASAIRSMSIEDAIAYARAHQPQIRTALARLAAQQEQANIPRSQWLPLVGVTAQLFAATANNTTGTYVSPGFIDIPRIGATSATATGSFQPYASTLAAAGVSQELYDFGRIAAQSAAEDARIDVEKQRTRAVTLDVTFDVEEAYFAVLAAKAIVNASQDAFDRSRAHRDLAKAGVDAGLRSPIELTRAEADLARFDIGRIRARGGLAIAQTTLAATVGVDDAALDVTETPKSPPDMPALETAIKQAATRDPRLLETIAQLRAEEARTRAIGAELRPDVALTATLSARAGGATPSGNGDEAKADGFLPNVPNWDVGVVFSWRLFDGTVRAREATSRAYALVRSEEIALVRHDEPAQIRLAYGNVDVARTALPGLQRSVDAARANYAQADARFRSGLGTSVELADAEAIRTDAEIQLALGQFALARARAAFGRVIAEEL
jgi:outer membrane protein